MKDFLDKDDNEAIEWLEQVVDNFREGITDNDQVNNTHFSLKK